jgi:hypothetical protein
LTFESFLSQWRELKFQKVNLPEVSEKVVEQESSCYLFDSSVSVLELANCCVREEWVTVLVLLPVGCMAL